MTWPERFGTRDRSEVERITAEQSNECAWLEDGSLRLLARAPAFRRHPRTGEQVWFNQAPVYCGSMSEELSGLAASGESPDPRVRRTRPTLDASRALDCCYGAGGALSSDLLDHVRRSLREASVTFPWRRGDVLLIDNLRVGHGRTPYRGERRVLAALVCKLWQH